MSKTEVRCVLRVQASTGESPVWCAEESLLYWVDIGEPALHRFDPATGRDEHWIMPTAVGCAAPAGGGRVLLALRTGVARFDCNANQLEMIASVPFDSRRFTPNDGGCDPRGRFWFGPMNSLLAPKPPEHERPAGGPLYRFDPDGRFSAMTPPVGCSNGLAWSPDGSTLYHAATEEDTVYCHDFDPDTGTLGPRRKFTHVEGGPDGASVDVEGFYWCALYGKGKVVRLDPATGRIEREIPVPARHPTMPAFGGPDLRTVYVTSASGGMTPEEKRAHPDDGALFAFEAPVPGLPTSLADPAYFRGFQTR